MSGTSSQVLNPPSLYSNLYSSLYLNVEFTDSLLKISTTIKKTTKRVIQIHYLFAFSPSHQCHLEFSNFNNSCIHEGNITHYVCFFKGHIFVKGNGNSLEYKKKKQFFNTKKAEKFDQLFERS